MITDIVIDLIYPRYCLGCGRLGSYCCTMCRSSLQYFSLPLCPGCGKTIPFFGVHPSCKKKTSLDGLFAYTGYAGIMKKLIKDMKYRGKSDKVHVLHSLSFAQLPSQYRINTTLIPVPLYASREKKRGFNQAQIIAQELSLLLSIPTNTHILQRTRATLPQAELKRKERLTNLTQAFQAKTATSKNRVVLVDDVLTTGSTLNACAIALKQAGYPIVYGLVLAHGK